MTRNISNSYADAYRAANKDERAAEAASAAIIRAVNKVTEAAGDAGPDLAGKLMAMREALLPLMRKAGETYLHARQTAESICAAAVNEAEAPVLEDGTCYDGCWEEPTDADWQDEPTLYDVCGGEEVWP